MASSELISNPHSSSEILSCFGCHELAGEERAQKLLNEDAQPGTGAIAPNPDRQRLQFVGPLFIEGAF